jgi:hypothetical protein
MTCPEAFQRVSLILNVGAEDWTLYCATRTLGERRRALGAGWPTRPQRAAWECIQRPMTLRLKNRETSKSEPSAD